MASLHRSIVMSVLLSCLLVLAGCVPESSPVPTEESATPQTSTAGESPAPPPEEGIDPEEGLAPGETEAESRDGSEVPETPSPSVEPAPEAPVDAEPPRLSDRVKVDAEAHRVVIPCEFVTPTQALEVFACHEEGPVHETVVVFRASGEDIYLGLLELGLRGPDFWNATSRVARGKPDVRYTLGDRVVVLLRFSRDGDVIELPAEKLMRETRLGTTPFVRGFTFSGAEVPVGDPPTMQIPRRVEITMGGPTRGEKAVDSILFHPNDVQELTPWVPALEIHPDHLPVIREMIEAGSSCELVLQGVSGEAELTRLARRHEEDPARRELLTAWLPVAEKIDRLKKSLASELEKMLELVAKGEVVSDPAEATRLATELQALVAGQRLERQVLEIWSLYLEHYVDQERLRTESLESGEEVDERAVMLATSSLERLRYELRFLAVEREALEIESRNAVLEEKDKLLLEGLAHRMEALQHESYLPLARSELDDLRRRLRDLDPGEDAYHVRLLEEKVLELEASRRQMQARRDHLLNLSEEKRARAAGEWQERRESLLELRRQILERLELADRHREKVEVLADMRWAENFLSDESLPESRRKKEEQNLVDLEKRLKELEAAIEALEKKVQAAAEKKAGEDEASSS